MKTRFVTVKKLRISIHVTKFLARGVWLTLQNCPLIYFDHHTIFGYCFSYRVLANR